MFHQARLVLQATTDLTPTKTASHRCDVIDTHLYPKIRVDFSRIPNLCELKFQAICYADILGPDDYHDDETEMDNIQFSDLLLFRRGHGYRRTARELDT